MKLRFSSLMLRKDAMVFLRNGVTSTLLPNFYYNTKTKTSIYFYIYMYVTFEISVI